MIDTLTNIKKGEYKMVKNPNSKMKPASVTFKTTPKLKEALENLAKEEFRTLSQQVEMIVIKYLQEHGVDWREEDLEK